MLCFDQNSTLRSVMAWHTRHCRTSRLWFHIGSESSGMLVPVLAVQRFW